LQNEGLSSGFMLIGQSKAQGRKKKEGVMKRSLLLLAATVGLLACNLMEAVLPRQEPLTPSAAAPTAAQSGGEETPSAQALPPTQEQATSQNCDSAQSLLHVRTDFPFQSLSSVPEHAVTYYQLHNTKALTIWFVDAEIETAPAQDEVARYTALARQHASQVLQRVVSRDACIAALFTSLEIIVVDGNYNAWFSASLAPDDVPGEEGQEASAFQNVYLRQSVPETVSETGQCTWAEARAAARAHFAGTEDPATNMDFYPLIDPRGLSVYAQWVAFSDTFITAAEMASVLNVAQEVNCLSRPVDQLVVKAVDKHGNVKMLGTLAGQEALKNLDISRLDFRVIP